MIQNAQTDSLSLVLRIRRNSIHSDFKNPSHLNTTINHERYLPTTAKKEQFPFLVILLLHKIKPCPWYYKGFLVKFCKFKTLTSLLSPQGKQEDKKCILNRRKPPCPGTH